MKKKINNEMSIASRPSSLIGYFLDHENYKRKEQVNVGGNVWSLTSIEIIGVVTGQFARKSSCTKLYGQKPESRRPKF